MRAELWDRLSSAGGGSLGRIGKRRGLRRTVEAKVQRNIALSDFRIKFGRDPLPGEPVFFEPDQDEPARLPEKVLEDAAIINGGCAPMDHLCLQEDGAHSAYRVARYIPT
jgi:hypothetical protein